MDKDKIRAIFISSEGDIPLTVERYNRLFSEQPHIKDYDVVEAITEDETTIFKRLRSLMTLKIFKVIMDSQLTLADSLENMKPSDAAKVLTSLMSVFAQMTAPVTKDTFDFDLEAEKAALELGVPVDEVKADLKKQLASSKS